MARFGRRTGSLGSQARGSRVAGRSACRQLFSRHLPLIPRNDVAIPPASPVGAVAQLGERLNGIQEVRGSIPLGSTIIPTGFNLTEHFGRRLHRPDL
ncbi:MAG: hypothetical protein QOF70_5495 [Acetobacteraceae bacterium]|jgi:hypothetical protein|nr:hypothetical protein [Acetobacteraceae bacterium]